MNRITFIAALLLATTACGFSSQNNEVSGQLKRVVHQTPLICPSYTVADLSMGSVQNGTGSVSKEDIWLYVENPKDVEFLENAAETGAIVTANYSTWRFILGCINDNEAHKLISVHFANSPT